MASIQRSSNSYALVIDGTAVLCADNFQEVAAWLEILGLTHSVVFA